MVTQGISIAGRHIAEDAPPFVIAEMSGNHKGDIERAKALIEAAREAGADAVKLQTYTPDTMTIRSDRPEFRIRDGLWAGRTLHDLYEEAHTPWEWHPALFEHARDVGITLFSTPFDPTAVDMLEDLDCPFYKIASAEIVDWGLLEKVAGTGKPVIVSTGMANLREITEALEVLRTNGAGAIVVLHCISAYPTPIEEANLRRIPSLAERLNVHVGLSDHTMGLTAGIVAVALGARVLEKHFTLKRADGGIDSAFSLEKEELAAYCQGVREAAASLGDGRIEGITADEQTRQFRRSLYFVRPLRAGEVITAAHVRSIRPANGLPPRYLKTLIGRRARCDIEAGTPVAWDLVEGGRENGDDHADA